MLIASTPLPYTIFYAVCLIIIFSSVFVGIGNFIINVKETAAALKAGSQHAHNNLHIHVGGLPGKNEAAAYVHVQERMRVIEGKAKRK